MNETAATAPRSLSRPVGLLLVIVASCSAYVVSQGARFGDATTYAKQIRSGALIEPGHLLWRPLGFVLGHALGTLDSYSSTLWTLQGMCLAASVIGLLATYLLCRNVAIPAVALFVSAIAAVSNGYWVYAFSGCSYTCGILFQTLALHWAIREREAGRGSRDALIAGVFGGLAACAWAINLLVAPAIVLALAATAGTRMRMRQLLSSAGAFALGYATTFVAPVALAYQRTASATQLRAGARTAAGVNFSQWLSTTRHDVPVHFGPTQLFRAAIGWAQSVLSLSDLGYRLRLWHFGEGAFPLAPWSLAFLSFYAAVLLLAVLLVRERSRLDVRTRSLIYVAVLAVGVNLAFGIAWQGTDLERYMPSWPFQMLLLAIALNIVWQRLDRARFLLLTCATLVVLVVANWQGTFEPVLAADSYRNLWVTAIRQHASRGDLLVVFGQRKFMIVAPHDENFPKIDNVSDEIEKGGAGWRATEINEIRQTQSRGGRVFLADSLFWTDSKPRDGWSFREYPVPTPRDLRDAFLPFRSDTVAFTAGREQVWLARTASGP
jgi:hypothetical protein